MKKHPDADGLYVEVLVLTTVVVLNIVDVISIRSTGRPLFPSCAIYDVREVCVSECDPVVASSVTV